MNDHSADPRDSLARLRHAVFAVGLALGVVMAWRAQAPGDAFYLLVRGWLLVEEGWLVPFGNPMSGGGFEPGPATSLLVALPLALVRDYRAVGFAVLLTHVVAFVLLDRSLRDAWSPRARLLFAVAYWLNPWRLHFSAHVWNPNWLFALGAVHLATARAQRERARFGMTLAHVLAGGVAAQLHGSALILALASGWLWWRRRMRVHWGGAALGVALVAASLVPWAVEAAEHPELRPAQDGFLGRGLVRGTFAKGALLLVRYASLHVGRQLTRFDFTPAFGPGVDAWLAPATLGFAMAAAALSLVPAAVAAWRLWRPGRAGNEGGERAWVVAYARACALAAVASFALSPTTPMMWQGFIVLHATVLPLVLWADRAWDAPGRIGRLVRRGATAWAACAVLLGLALAVGAPQYRRGGRRHLEVHVREPHAMLDELGVTAHATVRVDPDGMRSRLLVGRAAWERGDGPPPEKGEKW